MRKKAIGQIIVCSILAVILTGVLLTSIVLFRGYSGTLPISGKISEFVQNDALIQDAVSAAKDAFHSLPVPKLRLFGCVPVITFSNNDISIGAGSSDGTVPSGYILGAGAYAETPDQIKIEWASGRIYLRTTDASVPGAESGVMIYEYTGSVALDSFTDLPVSDVSEDRALISKMEGGTLKIEEFKKGYSFSGITNNPEKTLVVLVPSSRLKEIEIDCAAAYVSLDGLEIEKLDLDSATADIMVNACTIDSLDVDSATNDGTFLSCYIRKIDIDSATGSFCFDLINTPDTIDVDAMSGNYKLVLPKDASFSVDMDSLSASLSMPGFSANILGHNTVVGGGNSQFDFDLVSGEIIITAGGGVEGTSY